VKIQNKIKSPPSQVPEKTNFSQRPGKETLCGAPVPWPHNDAINMGIAFERLLARGFNQDRQITPGQISFHRLQNGGVQDHIPNGAEPDDKNSTMGGKRGEGKINPKRLEG